MRDGDHRTFVARQMLFEPVHTFRIEVIRRFVQKENGRLLQEQSGQGNASTFPAREVVDDLVRRRATESVHGHFNLRGYVPRSEPVDLIL